MIPFPIDDNEYVPEPALMDTVAAEQLSQYLLAAGRSTNGSTAHLLLDPWNGFAELSRDAQATARELALQCKLQLDGFANGAAGWGLFIPGARRIPEQLPEVIIQHAGNATPATLTRSEHTVMVAIVMLLTGPVTEPIPALDEIVDGLAAAFQQPGAAIAIPADRLHALPPVTSGPRICAYVRLTEHDAPVNGPQPPPPTLVRKGSRPAASSQGDRHEQPGQDGQTG